MAGTQALNPGNTCADLEVVSIGTARPVLDMYKLQLALQTRLREFPGPFDDLKSRVPNVLYWKYCFDEEFQELTDWLISKELTQATVKELQMEYIDMLHFLFNIGISLSVPATVISIELDGQVQEHDMFKLDAETLAKLLFMKHRVDCEITKLVSYMPWKRWKTYNEVYKEEVMPHIIECYINTLKLFFALGGLVDMDMQAIVNFFYAKNKENHARQDRGY